MSERGTGVDSGPDGQYTVRPGDTYERVSRAVYGVDSEGGRIAAANPGVNEPLQPGTQLVIPPIPDAPTDRAGSIDAVDPDEVALLINGERYRFWDSVTITRNLDSVDTVAFTAPFEPERDTFRQTFRPFSYRPLAVSVGGERLFTGTMVGVDPQISPARRAISVTGYSVPGVLQDCTPPASDWPVEYSDLTLRDIARAVCKPFGVPVTFQGDPGAPFETAAANIGTNVLPFLAQLAKERGFVIGTTPGGGLLFWRSVAPGRPVARLREGESPLLSVTPTFNPQEYYSHITGSEQTGIGSPGDAFTVRNERLRNTLRPHAYAVTDAQSADVAAAVAAKAGRMFGQAASYTAEVATWRDPSGALWRPNTTLSLHAHGAMIYTAYEFLIRRVTLRREAASTTATLELVVPGAYSGQIPETMPWDA